MAIDPRCPCDRSCQRRHAKCRLDCEDWKPYEATKRAEYEERAKESAQKAGDYQYYRQNVKRNSHYKARV